MGGTTRARAEAGKNTKNAADVKWDEVSVRGFSGAATSAGFRYKNRDDLAIIFSEKPARAAGVFTQNRVKAAPILWSSEVIARNSPVRAVIVNSGIANACTGTQGYLDVATTTRHVADELNVKRTQVLVASTGVIGEFLDTELLKKALPGLKKNLSPNSWLKVARAIMTTDTFPKIDFTRIAINSKEVNILGIAKGAGMIAPNMATMLAFVITDVAVHQNILQQMTKAGADQSFNRITVDGDTSTNDSLIVLANGAAGNRALANLENPDSRTFQEALNSVLFNLSQMIVKDGEGATKNVEVRVIGAISEEEAENIAFTVANSPLVKTAIHGGEANWGRIMAAVGRSDATIDPSGISIYFDDVWVVNEGISRGAEYEKAAEEVLQKEHFVITIDLGLGTGHGSVYTCDLSPKYVEINASYKT